MKSLKLIPLVLVVMATALFAQTDSTSKQAGPKQQAKLSVKKGQTFYYSVGSVVEVDSEQIQMETTTTTTFSAKVLEVTKDGGANFLVTCHTIKGALESPLMGEFEFDSSSDEEDENPMSAMLTKGLMALAGKTATVTTDSLGRVTKTVKGEEASEAPAGGLMGGLTGTSVSFSSIFTPLLLKMPKGGVSVGGSWKSASKAGEVNGSPVKLSQDGKVTLASATPKDLVYKSVAKPEMSGNVSDEEAGVEAGVEVQGGKVSITSTIDRKTGLQKALKQTIDMDMFINSPMGEMEMTLITKNEVKQVKSLDLPKKSGTTDGGKKPATDQPKKKKL